MKDGEIRARHYQTNKVIHVEWRAGTISRWEHAPAAASAEWWIAPPLVDLQINGYAGVDFQQDSLGLDGLLHATRELAKAGCTRYLLTFVTAEWTQLLERLRRFRKVREKSPELLHAVMGWHIEGPFLSAEPGFHGAHNPALMRDPTERHIRELREAAAADPVLLTMAPERPGALTAIELAVSLGMRVSLGHTDASSEILRRAWQAGATGFTHLANGCPQKLDRHNNILWRVLDQPALTVSLIPDQYHVSPALFRLIHKALPGERIYYTTDAMAAAGAPPGRYSLGPYQLEVGPDQIVRQPGQTNYAGSALTPIAGVQRVSHMLDCPWSEAWHRFSENPLRFMGLPQALGAGQPADFCLVRAAGDVPLDELQVFIGGERNQPV